MCGAPQLGWVEVECGAGKAHGPALEGADVFDGVGVLENSSGFGHVCASVTTLRFLAGLRVRFWRPADLQADLPGWRLAIELSSRLPAL